MNIPPMTPALNKLNFTAHVTTSVGWLGAVASFLVLSVAGLTSQDPGTVRGAYVAMNLIGEFLIVPLGLTALLTGLVQSLGTHWGLFRHYWVLVKFVLTFGATAVLLLHQFTAVAEAAKRVSASAAEALPNVGQLGVQLLADSGLAVLVLLVITTLGVYKPWGRTRYGQRKQQHERATRSGGMPVPTRPALLNSDNEKTSALNWGLKIFLAVAAVRGGFRPAAPHGRRSWEPRSLIAFFSFNQSCIGEATRQQAAGPVLSRQWKKGVGWRCERAAATRKTDGLLPGATRVRDPAGREVSPAPVADRKSSDATPASIFPRAARR